MNEERAETNLQALLLSAEHWLENWEDPITASTDAMDCECCSFSNMVSYYSMNDEDMCHFCPVFAATGAKNCYATPYYVASAYIDRCKESNYRGSADYATDYEKAKQACADEYAFLMGLALQIKPEEKDYER